MTGQGSGISVFDRNHIRRARRKAAATAGQHAFLIDRAADSLNDRLRDIRREFPRALAIGARGGGAFDSLPVKTLVRLDLCIPSREESGGLSVEGDEEALPFAASTFDLILSNFTLHAINDLPGALVQIRRALKPDGLFLAAMPGGETLIELRQAMMEAEISLRGGVSPRVAPFATKQQMGALLQRAGFALPVVDSEIVTVTYADAFGLMRDLRGMGESNAAAGRSRSLTGKNLLMETARIYAEKFAEGDGRIPATFEIVHLIGWAPHDSQQKPLRPGSAERSLAEALGADETSCGVRTDP